MKRDLKVAEALWDVKIGLDGVIAAFRKYARPDVVDFMTLAEAAGLTPSDNTTLGDIQRALGLSDTNTLQDAIDALTN